MIKFGKEHWQLLLIAIVIFIFWDTRAVWPLKMLVVFFHELSHAIAVVLTGGRVESITLNALQGGVTRFTGGSLFVSASAGYVGSLLFGVLLFVIAVRTHWDRLVVMALGIIMAGVAILVMRQMFALGFTIIFAGGLILSAKFLPLIFNDLVLRVVGLTSLMYAPYTIISDTLRRSYLRSDARIIAETYGGPTIMWGLIWLAISVAVLFATFRWGLKGSSNISWRQILPHGSSPAEQTDP